MKYLPYNSIAKYGEKRACTVLKISGPGALRAKIIKHI